MLRTNKDKVPMISVAGVVKHPGYGRGGRISVDGEIKFVVGTGGIVYNAQIGDKLYGWEADHLEPGVSTTNLTNESFNAAYNCFSCIGNKAEVISGEAKGATGIVTGKHGGAEHVMIHFGKENHMKMNIDDKIKVYGWGQGLKLLDYPDILLRNMSPDLLEKMNIIEENGILKVGVAKIVPQAIMGSGIGASSTTTGDYDITMHDEEMVEACGLKELRFGDIVAITDADGRFGRTWRKGAVSIGVVIHGNSFLSGHGPGVTALMSSRFPLIEPFIDEKANLADIFGV